MVADSACSAPEAEAGGKYCSNISPVLFPAISLLFRYIQLNLAYHDLDT